MRSVIIRKRTLTLLTLSLVGLTLLFLGWRGDLLERKSVVPGMQVGVSSTGEVRFEQTGESMSGKNKTGAGAGQPEVGEGSDFFVEYRLERERTRGQRVEWLREVINNAGSSSESRQKAQDHLLSISRSMEKEVELENLIRARGFKDAAVFLDEQSVTVIVAAAKITQEEAARINELVSRGAGVEVKNIVIIPKA